jgi:hypothetical protein
MSLLKKKLSIAVVVAVVGDVLLVFLEEKRESKKSER